jgi:hypothetical protein
MLSHETFTASPTEAVTYRKSTGNLRFCGWSLEGLYTVVVPDASGFRVGASLTQNHSTANTRRPLAFYSAKLSSAECNYPVGEQESLAVVSGLEMWICHLEGVHGGVTVVTNHLTIATDHLPYTFLDS